MSENKLKQYLPAEEPWDAYDQVLNRGEAGKLARLLACSPQLIRDYCREPETAEDNTATGRRSDLERLAMTIDFIHAADGSPERAYPFGHFIAAKLHGVFVPFQKCFSCSDSEATKAINAIMKEVSEAIEHFRQNWFEIDPQRFTPEQSSRTLKEIDEALVALQHARQFVQKHSVADK